MPFDVTSGTDRADVLTELESFAATYGWTTVYDEISIDGQLGISNGNCFCALGDGSTTLRTDSVNGGSLTDGFVFGALGTSLTAGNTQFWGHPGSIVTSSGDTDRVEINDLAGPFSNIYLFTDDAETYIHCVVQSSADRYTFFSLGNLNKNGLSHSDIGYLTGMSYVWWPNAADFSANSGYAPNNIGNATHSLGFLGHSETNFFIPNGVLDTAFGFSSGDIVIASSGVSDRMFALWRRSGSALASVAALAGFTAGAILDPFFVVGNDQTTGGAPLWSIPYFFYDSSSAVQTYLGDLPDVRMVNLTGFASKDIVTYGSDEWQLFPIKAFGDSEASNWGSNPAYPANTERYGIAIKRVPNP